MKQPYHTSIEAPWRGLYRLAGMGLILTIALILADMTLSFTGGDVATGTYTAVDWFGYFQRQPLLGLRNLGIFNIINPLLGLPLYLALYQLHRRDQPAAAALALALLLLGSAVYIANNRALAFWELSQQYAAATSEAQRALLASAGTVLLAEAEDFTPGTFAGFFISTLGALGMYAVMLRGGIFRRWLAWMGLAGAGLLLIFTILVTFAPGTFNAAMILAMLGGLLMLAWNILTATRLFRLAGGAPSPAVLTAAETGRAR